MLSSAAKVASRSMKTQFNGTFTGSMLNFNNCNKISQVQLYSIPNYYISHPIPDRSSSPLGQIPKSLSKSDSHEKRRAQNRIVFRHRPKHSRASNSWALPNSHNWRGICGMQRRRLHDSPGWQSHWQRCGVTDASPEGNCWLSDTIGNFFVFGNSRDL